MILAASPVSFGAATSTSSTTSSSTSTSSTVSSGTSTTTTSTSVPATSSTQSGGYWVVRANGVVSNFGVPSFGDLSKVQLSQPDRGRGGYARGSAATGSSTSSGGVYAFGDAQFEGSPGGAAPLTKPIVGMAATPDGLGYWFVACKRGCLSPSATHSWTALQSGAITRVSQ